MLFRKKRIYADAAAATPLSRSARRELLRLLPLFGNPGALHKEALIAKEELERARTTIARALGAHGDEIVFTASGTEANNLAIQGLLRPLLLERGEVNAITSTIEHPSVLMPLQALEREGLYLTTLPVDGEGLVDPKALREALNEQTVFVSVQMVNSEIGAIEPIRELAKEIRHERKSRRNKSLSLYFHTDACQAPLWLSINVEKLGVDLMTLDGQKVLGPKGVGCLYSRRGTQLEPLLWGGGQEQGLRSGTENVPLAGAFAVALAEAQQGVKTRAEKISVVRDYLWSEIKKLLPEASLYGPTLQRRVANNLNFSIPGLEGEMAVIALDSEDIATSTRSACDTGETEPSHVMVALKVPESLAKTALRITLLPDATKRDARRIANTLASTAERYGKK